MPFPTQSQFVCRTEDLADGEAKGFPAPNAPGQRAILIVRWEGKIYGYWNRCAHQGTPLDWKPNQFFNPAKTHLQCATHAAQFRIEDGYCVAGPCKGKSLESIPLRLEGEKIYLEI
ncbi:MAG: Rieske (2Fe-2S) protein [Alphaproteobacteria bacterium]